MGDGKREEPWDEKTGKFITEVESDGGNIGKYQRVKGGKTEKSRGYSVLWKVKKCLYPLQKALLENSSAPESEGTQDEKSREQKACPSTCSCSG